MILYVDDIALPELAPYASLTGQQLRNRLDPTQALFIAESPKVIRVALDAGCEPVSLLMEQKHLTGDAADIVARVGDIPIYTGSRELLAALTGYRLTRGVLCAMRRPKSVSPEEICEGTRRVVVIDGVSDSTNVGTIFRSAAALGMDAVLLTPSSCDPLCRRAVRVSMGAVFLVPWAWLDDAPLQPRLSALGFRSVAMALVERSVSIDDEALMAEPRLAIVMGTEGDGLSTTVINDADYVARIPMLHGVDSLNVAAAAAVAFWQLRVREKERDFF